MTQAIKQKGKAGAKEQETPGGIRPGTATEPPVHYHDMTPTLVPLELIDDNPHGFERPDSEALQEHIRTLAASIKSMWESGARPYGLIHYPTARKAGDRYQLADGSCRRRAFALLLEETRDDRWSRLPVMVSLINDELMGDIAWRENHDRQDIDPITMVRFYRKQLETLHITQEALASRLGITQSAIAHALRLLELPEPVLDLIKGGQLTARHGRELLVLNKKPDQLVKVAERAAKEDLSVGETGQAAGITLRGGARSLGKEGYPNPQFDTKACAGCENYVKLAVWKGKAPYCLNPKCWDKKQKEAVAESETAKQKKIEEIAKSQGAKTLALSELNYSDYSFLDEHNFKTMDKPEECQGCEHRVKGIDRDKEIVDVCLKPKCSSQKAKLYREAENFKQKQHEAKFNVRFDEVLAGLGARSPLSIHTILCMVADKVMEEGRDDEEWAPEYGLTPRPDDVWPQPPLGVMFKELRPADIVRIIVRESYLCQHEDDRRKWLRLIKEDLRLPLTIEDEPAQVRERMVGIADDEMPKPAVDAPWYAKTVFDKSYLGKVQPACWGEFMEDEKCTDNGECEFRVVCCLLRRAPILPVEAEALKDLGIRLARHVHHDTTCQGCELGPTDHTMEWRWPQPVCLKDVLAAGSQALRPQDRNAADPQFQEAAAATKKKRGKSGH